LTLRTEDQLLRRGQHRKIAEASVAPQHDDFLNAALAEVMICST
jgi:hypothetical protein